MRDVIRTAVVPVMALAMLAGSEPVGAQLPPQASATAEAQVEGTLEVLVEDHATGAAIHHYLVTSAARLRLQAAPGQTDLEGLMTGTRVRARGRLRNNTLELSSSQGSVETLALASPNTFGEQRVAVILVNFQDTSVPYNWSVAQDVTFNQASNFFRESSYGQTWLTGDVFGWYNIAMSKNSCDTNLIASLADQAAANQGVNLNNYSRRVYAFPSNACGWWGLGTVGGNPSRAWIKGSYQLKVVAHELGHNFGDYHSKSQPCDSAGCTLIEYGDDRDMMGQSGIGHFNAYQKERLGWLNYAGSPAIQTVTGSGTYWVESLQTSGTAAKALKILKSSSSSARTYYYVESRTRTGYDNNYTPGVVLHTGIDTNGNTSHQIDMDRVTSSFDAILNPGQSFVDAAIGLTITTVSSDAAGSWVTIDYGGMPCTAAAPTVSVGPSGIVGTAPSQAVSFSITVRNNDDAACASGDFAISVSTPSGWTSSGPSQMTVPPGATTSANFWVTPASTSGVWDVSFTASRGSGGGGFAVGRVAVATSLGMALTTIGGSNYQASAAVTVAGTPASGVSVAFQIRDPKGAVSTVSAVTNSSGVAIVKGRLKGKAPKGTYWVTATASSGSLAGSATGSFVY